jgi:flagellin
MFSPNQTTEGVPQMARIVTNSSAITVFKNYNRAQVGLASSAEKLATGLRINRASDDSAGLAISETMRAQIKGSSMAVENINNANSFINTADGYLQNVNDILGRLEELAVEYSDFTKSSADLGNLSSEFDALKTKATAIMGAASTYNGAAIFSASARTIAINAEGTTESVSGLDPSAVTTALGSAVIGTPSTIQTANTAVSTMRGNLGASQSKLNYTLIGLENYVENVSAAEGRIRNVDMAKETTTFSKQQILGQSGLAMLGQANASAQSVLRLLG